MSIIYAGLIFLLFGTLISLLFKKKVKITIYSIVLIITCTILLSSIFFKEILVLKLPLNFIIENDNQFDILINLNFQLNNINILFILVLSIIIFSISLYLPYYLNSHEISNPNINFHIFNFSILIASLVLLFTTNNLLIFLILWELMGISSFFCIFFDGDDEETVNAAIQYLIFMHLSFIFLLIGSILVYKVTGSFHFENIKSFFICNSTEILPIKTILYIIFTIGFVIKLGIFPFHFWLPKAHPASPSHFSAFMSSIVIKTGLFGLLVILNLFGMPDLSYSKILIFVGLISSIIGIINATSQNQIKRFLAYSSVENAGMLLFFYGSILFGFINENYFLYLSSFIALFIYLINHALSKLSAFLGAGIIINEMGYDNLDYLGGIANKYPFLAASNFLSSISLSAIPPFGNFVGELLVLIGYSNYIINNKFSIIPFLVFFILGLIGAITLLAFTKYFTTGFLGVFRSENKINAKKIFRFTIISLFLPLILSLILASPYFIGFYFDIVKNTSINLLFSNIDFTLEVQIAIINSIIKIFYYIVIILTILITISYLLYKKLNVKKSSTWGCGYIPKDKDIFQYSSTSFVEPFITIFKSLTGLKIKRKEEDVIFNKEADIEIEHHDIINKNILDPILKKANELIDRLTIIQSGKTQHYILYGLIFLTIIIIITLIKYL